MGKCCVVFIPCSLPKKKSLGWEIWGGGEGGRKDMLRFLKVVNTELYSILKKEGRRSGKVRG